MGKKNLFFICGYCGKTLKHRSRTNDKYFCRTGSQQFENDCQRVNVRIKELEDAVVSGKGNGGYADRSKKYPQKGSEE